MKKISTSFSIPLEELVEAHTRGQSECGRFLRDRIFDPKPVKSAA